MRTSIAESLLFSLRENGAQQIFGIPGDFALPFFKVIEESQILPLYTLSHEPGIGFAADAAGRYTSTLSVVAVTYGAGALNMVNSVAAAYAEKSPLVVISGAPGRGESRAGLLLHHQAKTLDSQFQIYKEITCDQVKLDDPLTAPELISQALNACHKYSRPVYIELPRDCVSLPCEAVPQLERTCSDPQAVSACGSEIYDKLLSALSPVLLVGVGIRRYRLENKVALLAKRLGLPVVTTFMGRGLLADTDAPLIGTYMGRAGSSEVTKLVEQSDALFMLGAIFSDTNFGVCEQQIDGRNTVQAINNHVSLGYHVYPDITLADLVDELLLKVDGSLGKTAKRNISYPSGMPADNEKITPLDIAKAINDLMKEVGNFPIASDMGDCLFTALDISNTALVAPGYYATMGFGVPAGLGLQAASGQRPLILVGDGAFQMTGWELGNCGKYGWDPIVIVFNNRSWEMLRAFQPESKFNDLSDWNFAELANGLGGDGVRVETRCELKSALDNAVRKKGRFQLIDVIIPRGCMSDTLRRFAGGIKEIV